jgi:hypothetical protein
MLADLLGRVAGYFSPAGTRQSYGQMVHGLLMELTTATASRSPG